MAQKTNAHMRRFISALVLALTAPEARKADAESLAFYFMQGLTEAQVETCKRLALQIPIA